MSKKSGMKEKILTKRARSCIFGLLLPRRFLSIFKASFACLQLSTKFQRKNRNERNVTISCGKKV